MVFGEAQSLYGRVSSLQRNCAPFSDVNLNVALRRRG